MAAIIGWYMLASCKILYIPKYCPKLNTLAMLPEIGLASPASASGNALCTKSPIR